MLGSVSNWVSDVVDSVKEAVGLSEPASTPAQSSPEPAQTEASSPSPQSSADAQSAHQADPTAQAIADRAQAKVADNTPVLSNGNLDPQQFLARMSQFDNDPLTMDDPRRCGATSAIAVAVTNGGKEGLQKLVDHLAQANPGDPDIENAQKKLRDGTLTYGDLGKLGSAINAYYSADDGMHGPALGQLLRDAGIPAPSGNPKDFAPGQTWPIMIDTDRDGTANHWVVVGKTPEGKPFIYDPWPKEGQPQVALSGTPEFERLSGLATGRGSGFASRS